MNDKYYPTIFAICWIPSHGKTDKFNEVHLSLSCEAGVSRISRLLLDFSHSHLNA